MKSEKMNITLNDPVQREINDSLPLMLALLDDNNRIVWHNRKTRNFFGKSVRGELFRKLFSINPDDLNKPKLRAISIARNKNGEDKILEHNIIKSKTGNSRHSIIVISEDVTDSIGNGKLLGFLLEFESLLTRLALESINIQADEIDSHLDKLLLLTGKFAEVERCYIALFDEKRREIIITHGWNVPEYSTTENLTRSFNIPKNWIRKKKTDIISIPDIKKIKYESEEERRLVCFGDLHSAMLFPLFNKNNHIGYIGFSTTRMLEDFPPELKSIFRITAELAVNLFEKKEAYTQIAIAEKIISRSSSMLAFFDKNGQIRTTNEAFREFHSLTDNRTDNLQIYSLFNDRLGSRENVFNEYIKESLNGKEIHEEIWYNHKERLRLLEISLYPNFDNDGTVSSVILNSNDITDRVQLEAKILEVIHQERKKIGISLHDDLGHDLLAVAIKSRLISDKLKNISEDLSSEVNEIEIAIKSAISEVRRLSHGLIPYKNHGLEFNEMIDAVALTIERDYKLKCEFMIDSSIHINDESIIKELYYIIDEAVMNSLKHSGCSEIKISMSPKNRMIALTIMDDGCGIQIESKTESGVGLEIMKYRARSIGGFLDARKLPDGGTIIECIFNPEKIKL